MDQIFKAYDVRGKVGSELTPDVVNSIGKAVANWLPTKGSVAVGRDMRPDSEELAKAMINGLVNQGRDVIDVGQVTSDMIYFSAGFYNLAGGIMITASHNPGEYNGIKFCGEQAKPIGIESGLAEIRDLAITNTWQAKPEGTISQKDVINDWLNHVLSFIDIDKLKPLKVIIDAGNGMAGKIIPHLEPRLPLEVTEMYFELDGTFPNHIANPIEPANIQDLINRVKTENADVGVAFDGDGDRAVLIDENGHAISGTALTAMLADFFLQQDPNQTILYNATCGWIVPEIVKSYGGTAIRTKVGHSYIKAEMRKHNAIFAGESSGHYYFRDNYNADSGLIACVVALYVLSISNKPLSSLVSQFNKYHHIAETNFEVKDKQAMITRISKLFKDNKQDTLDGLTVWFDDAWINIRPSNTEPILRLNIEAKTKDKLNQLVDKVTTHIKN
ncbi:MAG: phosphomannomutase/phosphoglucomutase [Candidatus Nomurabacteria bacterium]|nr:MAG: phosphomannomutase/phosphoglucomutase [Candidatus Nomurabacteria bacterium]